MSQRRGLRAERLGHASGLGDTAADHAAGAHEVLREGARYPLVGGEVALPDGTVWREWTQHPGAVAVIATRPGESADAEGGATAPGTPDPEVYCVRQYRHPVRSLAWEIPAGLLDVPGEPMAAAAARELAEEAALTASTWATLVDFHTTPGGSAEAIRVFWATDVQDVASDDFQREAEEADMEGHWVRLSHLLDAVHAGRVHNPSTVIGALALDRVLAGRGATRPADAPFELGPVGLR